MASRRVIKSINWTALAERIAEEEKPIFATFRTKSDGYLRRMQANPESAPAIDWALYKKNIVVPGMVEQFQKQYDSLKINYPADTYTAKIEAEEMESKKHVQDFIIASNERIEAAEKEVARIEALMPFEEMTMEDAAEIFPDNYWNPDKPSMWPHTPEMQPGPEPEPIPRGDH